VVMGSPVSVLGFVQSIGKPPPQEVVVGSNEVAEIVVENYGYVPELLSLPANQPIELHLVTNDTRSCARAFTIPALNIMEILPQTGDTVIQIPAQSAGTSMQFACSMGMFGGKMVFK
jgi:uncharacterized protein